MSRAAATGANPEILRSVKSNRRLKNCHRKPTRDDPAFAALRRSELIGRPLGDEAFLDAISRRLNGAVTPRKRGRKPQGDVAGAEAKG